MGPLGLRAEAAPPATSVAGERVRARWAAQALLGIGVVLVAATLWVHPLLALIPLAGVLVPPIRRTLVETVLAAPSASLAFGLAVVAAAAVGYASASAVAPVVALALAALLAQRAVVLCFWTGLTVGGADAPERAAEWAGVAVALLLVATGWGFGWLPAMGDGAVAAACTLAAGGVLRA